MSFSSFYYFHSVEGTASNLDTRSRVRLWYASPPFLALTESTVLRKTCDGLDGITNENFLDVFFMLGNTKCQFRASCYKAPNS